MKPFITWRQRPTDYKVEMWEEVALLHSLYFINTTFQHGTVQYRCFKTNIFTVDITQSFTQPHLHFVRFETKKNHANNQRERTCFTDWPKNLHISTPSKNYHSNKIIENYICYWLHHRDTHCYRRRQYCPVHSIHQLPAMLVVLIYIHLAISLLLPPIVILKYNSDYTGDCGVIKSRFICMIMVITPTFVNLQLLPWSLGLNLHH